MAFKNRNSLSALHIQQYLRLRLYSSSTALHTVIGMVQELTLYQHDQRSILTVSQYDLQPNLTLHDNKHLFAFGQKWTHPNQSIGENRNQYI